MKYDDLSRRGLIKLNNQYDNDNNNQLKEYAENIDSINPIERIRPYEEVAQKIDNLSEAMQHKGGQVSRAMLDRVNHMFDAIVESMKDEADRCDEVEQEQEDDNEFPNDDEDE